MGGIIMATINSNGTMVFGNVFGGSVTIVPTNNTSTNYTLTIPNVSGSMAMGESIGRRNYLINGNFDKWDYGTSQTASGYGSDNRWQNNNSGSTKTHSQIACGDTERALFNAMYFSRTIVSSVAGAGNLVHKVQAIENINLLAGKTVTLSFWAKADSNKNVAVEFWQNFGSGGSPSASYTTSSQLVALTTTWQKKTIIVALPSIVGKTLGTDGVQTTINGLTFWFDAGSNFAIGSSNLGQQSGTFDIAQVKVEDGSVATNGWHPYDGEFGGEIQACARYYEISDKANTLASEVTDIANRGGGMWYFRIVKRIVPTIIFNGALSDYTLRTPSNATNITVTALSSNATGLGSTRLLANVSSGVSQGQGTILNGITNNGYVSASAEL
jgi:hypothetical protein